MKKTTFASLLIAIGASINAQSNIGTINSSAYSNNTHPYRVGEIYPPTESHLGLCGFFININLDHAENRSHQIGASKVDIFLTNLNQSK